MNKNKLRKKIGLVCAGIGSAGYIWTAIDAARCAKKTDSTFKEQKGFKAKTKYLFRNYWRPILEGTASTAVVIGGSVIDYKAIVGLTGAAAAGYKKYDEYRKANIETNGEEADKRVLRKIAGYRHGIITPGHDEVLFCDDFTGEFFVSTWVDVINAIRKMNRNFQIAGYEPFYDYLDMLGILTPGLNERYDDWGWDKYILETDDGMSNIDIDESFPEDKTDDGQVFYHIRFIVDPYSPEESALAGL